MQSVRGNRKRDQRLNEPWVGLIYSMNKEHSQGRSMLTDSGMAGRVRWTVL